MTLTLVTLRGLFTAGLVRSVDGAELVGSLVSVYHRGIPTYLKNLLDMSQALVVLSTKPAFVPQLDAFDW